MASYSQALNTDVNGVKVSARYDSALGIWVHDMKVVDLTYGVKTAPVIGVKTVSTSAAEIFAGASRLANRYSLGIYNDSAYTVYWGPSGVTTATGFPILPGDSLTLQFATSVATAIYCIAAASAAVRVVELA